MKPIIDETLSKNETNKQADDHRIWISRESTKIPECLKVIVNDVAVDNLATGLMGDNLEQHF